MTNKKTKMKIELPARVHYWQYSQKKYDEYTTTKKRIEEERFRLIPRHKKKCNAGSDSKTVTGMDMFEAFISGLKRIDEITDTTGEKVFKRDPVQVVLHSHMTVSVLPSMFKNDLAKYLHILKKKLGFKYINPNKLITAPRRFGKTYALAIFAFIFALTQKDVELPIFSPGRRASSKLLALIFKIGCHYFKSTSKWYTMYNSETLEIRNIWGGKSIIRAYPSNAKISHFFIFF